MTTQEVIQVLEDIQGRPSEEMTVVLEEYITALSSTIS